jgi:MFS family permease
MDPQPERVATSITIASYARLVRRNRNFRRLWLAQIVSEIGDWFYTLSIFTLLLQLTGSASSVALALVLQVLPQTLVGPMAGVVNDRLKRKHVMIAADLGRCIVVLAMLFVRSRSMVWLIYPLLVLETTMAAFFEPARSAVIPNITSEGEVLAANTLSSATWSVNLLIGAAVGGVVAAFFGREVVFGLNALSFLVSAVLIGGMRFAEPHAEAAAPLRPRDLVDFSPVVEGIRYIRSHPTLFPAVFAKAGELMIGPSWVIFTVLGT